jgi:hypothetical protein
MNKSKVNRWNAFLSVLCLAIWLPATQHCNLENLPGFSFLACSADETGTTDCEGDSCQTVENGAYKIPDNGDFALIPVLSGILIDVLVVAEAQPLCPTHGRVSEPPEPRSETWQFYSSFAVPIRGPSFCS